jgi:CubicO group peptidase (beta-lactamase class C family)
MALSARGRASRFKGLSPGMLPPLGIIFGLFVAFIAAQVWGDIEHANAAINREACALRTVVLFAAAFRGEAEARLRDLARFGELMRLQGRWNGRQILPSAVIEEIRRGGSRELFPKAGYKLLPGWSYRNMSWVSDSAHGAFTARGSHGQAIYVDPTAEMVIARFASHPHGVQRKLLERTRRRDARRHPPQDYLADLITSPLLIIDDLGMRKLPHAAAEDLLEVIMRRYERASTLLTSNRPSTIGGSCRAAPPR